jgi:hypothetical protein
VAKVCSILDLGTSYDEIHVDQVSNSPAALPFLLIIAIQSAWTRIVREGDRVSNQWPLALCDISKMDPAIDLEPSDVVHAKTATEQALVYYHEDRDWYFLNSQQPGEMLLFLQSDTAKGSTAGYLLCRPFYYLG